MSTSRQAILESTRCWLERMVLAHNLCPFARKPYAAGQVRFVVSEARDEDALLADLQDELQRLQSSPLTELETTVLIHPYVLQDFYQYNDFLAVVDHYLELARLEGVFQVASLHPQYQFADAAEDDLANYTNRSPYPILHLLREESVSRALASYARPDKIPERNIRKLHELGRRAILDTLMSCRSE